MKNKRWIATIEIKESFEEELSRGEILEMLSFDTPHYVDIKLVKLEQVNE